MVLRLHTILAAAGGFLHGFVGLGALPHDSATSAPPKGDQNTVACVHPPPPSAAAVRRALAIRAAGRRNCC